MRVFGAGGGARRRPGGQFRDTTAQVRRPEALARRGKPWPRWQVRRYRFGWYDRHPEQILLPEKPSRADPTFRHEALFYSGDDGFLAGTVPFLSEAIDSEQPSLVVVSAARIAMLRRLSATPATTCSSPTWPVSGATRHASSPRGESSSTSTPTDGRAVRGIGEPIWATRTPAELVECQRHEALLNVALPTRRHHRGC